MTIADNLNRIVQAKADIKAAIENKGVAVGDLTIDSYAEKIGEIPQDVAYNGLDFTVIGYDATLTRELNDEFNADIQYSLQKYNEWNPYEASYTKVFQNDKKLVYAPLVDTYFSENMYAMFEGCTNLKTVPLFNTSRVTNMGSMFEKCSSLTTVPLFDFSKMENMVRMFYDCTSLTTVPLFDTQNVTNMNSVFTNCTSLTTVPLYNTSKVTTVAYLFNGCSSLTEVPHLDTSKATDVGSMFNGCKSLTEVPLFDFSNVTTITYFFGFSELKNITTLGGFKDLKIDWNDNYGLAKCPNLTYESVMNVINNLYDFRGNGDEATTKTIKFHSNSLALLSDDDKAIASMRGWVLS